MGVWLLPIRLNFKGVLFTEQGTDLNALDLRNTELRAAEQLKSAVKLSGARLDREGRLEINYEGKRYAMILVLSRSADVGRTFIHALYNTLPAADTGPKPEVPWELFPGILPRTGETIASPVNVSRRLPAGNFSLIPGAPKPLKIDCESGVTGDLVFQNRAAAPGTCVEALSFPTMELGPAVVQQHPSSVNSSVFLVNGSAGVRVGCSDLKICKTGSSLVSIPASFSKERTISTLSTDPRLKEAMQLLDTDSLVAEPHKIHSLGVLVKTFYNSINIGARVGTWHEVSVCRNLD